MVPGNVMQEMLRAEKVSHTMKTPRSAAANVPGACLHNWTVLTPSLPAHCCAVASLAGGLALQALLAGYLCQ